MRKIPVISSSENSNSVAQKGRRGKFQQLARAKNDFSGSDYTSSQSETEFTDTDRQEGDSEEEGYSFDEDNESRTLPKIQKLQTRNTSSRKFTSGQQKMNIASKMRDANYLTILPLPVFKGDPSECPALHICRFDLTCRANNTTDPALLLRLFPTTLDGEAIIWFHLDLDLDLDLHSGSDTLSWEALRLRFLQNYRKTDFRSELLTIRQGEEETVNSFHLRFRWILKKWPDLRVPDSTLKSIFIDGLKDQIHEWIIHQSPESVEAAARLAKAWEHAEAARDRRKKISSEFSLSRRCGFCDGLHSEGDCEVRGLMREMWKKGVNEERVAGKVPESIVGSERKPETKMGSSSRRVEEKEREEEEGGRSLRRMKSQCLCSKHQCGKKSESERFSIEFPLPTD
ncbi:hypothetical protein AMTRI_Chr01g113960 [Amborella trichopoda]